MPNRILIVDDDALVRAALQTALARSFSVETASNLTEARQKIEESPDAIVLDIALGAENGLRVVEELQRTGNPIPVVVVTGTADVVSAHRAGTLGVTKVLAKPLDGAELEVELLRAIVHAHSTPRHDRKTAKAFAAQVALKKTGSVTAAARLLDTSRPTLRSWLRSDSNEAADEADEAE